MRLSRFAFRAITLGILLLTVCLAWRIIAAPLDLAEDAAESDKPPLVATFSIVACDLETGEWGVAVQSRVLAVGSLVPFARAGVGAIATQAYCNTTYGPRGLAMLEEGKSAEEVLAALIADDEDREQRQLAVVDAQGRVANHTGSECFAFAGAKAGTHFSCQGNILAGEEVVDAMARAFETAEGDLAAKLLVALAAGQEAGGDKRGQQSAALLVVQQDAGYGGFDDRKYDLRVDDHEMPIDELKRLLRMHWNRRQ